MNDHITKFNELVIDLLNLDEKLSNIDKALMLLAALHNKSEHLIVTLLHGKSDGSFDE